MFSIKHCLKKHSFCSLAGDFEVNSKGWHSFTFPLKSYEYVILWWNEHCSQSKFEDNIESLNIDTADFLCVILMIEREKSMKSNLSLKCDVFFKHHLLVNLNIEKMYSSEADGIFLSLIKGSRKSNFAKNRILFYMILLFRKGRYQNNVWRNTVSVWIVPKQTRFKLYLKISYSNWFHRESLYGVLCLGAWQM